MKTNDKPINVAIPNTSKEKMEAILNLSKTVYELSRALSSVNTQVTISNNTIAGMENGILIKTE